MGGWLGVTIHRWHESGLTKAKGTPSVGQKFRGKVAGLSKWGAFVDIGKDAAMWRGWLHLIHLAPIQDCSFRYLLVPESSILYTIFALKTFAGFLPPHLYQFVPPPVSGLSRPALVRTSRLAERSLADGCWRVSWSHICSFTGIACRKETSLVYWKQSIWKRNSESVLAVSRFCFNFYCDRLRSCARCLWSSPKWWGDVGRSLLPAHLP